MYSADEVYEDNLDFFDDDFDDDIDDDSDLDDGEDDDWDDEDLWDYGQNFHYPEVDDDLRFWDDDPAV